MNETTLTFTGETFTKDKCLSINPDITDQKILKYIKKPIKYFAKDVNPEEVLLFIDTSKFQRAKEGVLFTSDKMYSKKTGALAYEDIKFIKASAKVLVINHHTIDLSKLKGKNIEMIYHILKEHIGDISSGTESMVEEVFSLMKFDLDDVYHPYKKPYMGDKDVQKQLANALKTFAQGVEPQDVLLLIDTTALGSAKRGFVFTSDAIYSHAFAPLSYFALRRVYPHSFLGARAMIFNKSFINLNIEMINLKSLSRGLHYIMIEFAQNDVLQEQYKSFLPRSKFSPFTYIPVRFHPFIYQYLSKFKWAFFIGLAIIAFLPYVQIALGVVALLVISAYLSKSMSLSDAFTSLPSSVTPFSSKSSSSNKPTSQSNTTEKVKEPERRAAGYFRVNIGGMDPNSKVRAYEKGGVYSLDRVDGTGSNTAELRALLNHHFRKKVVYEVLETNITIF